MYNQIENNHILVDQISAKIKDFKSLRDNGKCLDEKSMYSHKITGLHIAIDIILTDSINSLKK